MISTSPCINSLKVCHSPKMLHIYRYILGKPLYVYIASYIEYGSYTISELRSFVTDAACACSNN